ncbi:DUF6174 domain-containing protein [Colwellia piezophila]|uniref:DUF6174 domain-containing protein n=1 Tax=Colwellia piezophila TaxID=211668 RepID=UPI00036D2638|nr:DUF6174 domain-containing protein [Colwellia piezophila]
MLKQITSILLITCLAACNDDNSNPKFDLIEKNQAIWNENNLLDYEFHVTKYSPNCPNDDNAYDGTIVVENGVVSTVYDSNHLFTHEVSSWPTIYDIFTELMADIQNEPEIFSKSHVEQSLPPQFNAEYGFPSEYFIDKTNQTCDETLFKISKFAVFNYEVGNMRETLVPLFGELDPDAPRSLIIFNDNVNTISEVQRLSEYYDLEILEIFEASGAFLIETTVDKIELLRHELTINFIEGIPPEDQGVVCTDIIQSGLWFELFDKETGERLHCDATITIEDGDYIKELVDCKGGSSSAGNGDFIIGVGAAPERGGIYNITIEKEGYQNWYQSNVEVSEGICHVNQVQIQAYLEK